MTAHPCIADIAGRIAAIDKSIARGKFDMSSALSKYAWVTKDGNIGMAHLSAALPEHADDDDASVPFIISTAQIDRDGDIVVPMGMELDEYARNPVIFLNHQSHPIPIAKAQSPDGKLAVFKEEMLIRSVAYFDKADSDAMFVYGKVRRGFLNAASIAFVPIEAVRRDQETEKGYSERAHTHSNPGSPDGWKFIRASMSEWSCVGVPANAGAIRDSLDREKSFITPRLQKALQPYAAKAVGCWQGWCESPGGLCVPCEAKPAPTKAAPMLVEKGPQSRRLNAYADELLREIKQRQLDAGVFVGDDYITIQAHDRKKIDTLIALAGIYEGRYGITVGVQDWAKSAKPKHAPIGKGVGKKSCGCGKASGACGCKSVAKNKPVPPSVHNLPTEQEAQRTVREQAAWWPDYNFVVGRDADGWFVKPVAKAMKKKAVEIFAIRNSKGQFFFAAGNGSKWIDYDDGQRWTQTEIGADLAIARNLDPSAKAVPMPKKPAKSLLESSGTAGGYTVAVEQGTASPSAPGVQACTQCGGSGNCTACEGVGEKDSVTCEGCGGDGNCAACSGVGKINKAAKQAKGSDMAARKPTAKKAPTKIKATVRRKAVEDEEDKEDLTDPGSMDGAGSPMTDEGNPEELKGEDDPNAEPFTPKDSAIKAAKGYAHLRELKDYYGEGGEGDLRKMDNPGMAESLKARMAAVEELMAGFKEDLHQHHGDGTTDPEALMEKHCKALGGADEFQPGEAGMVENGNVPPEPEEEEDEVFAADEPIENEEEVVPVGDADPDTEEILERYQRPKSKQWSERTVGVGRRAKNGRLYIVRRKQVKVLPGGKHAICSGDEIGEDSSQWYIVTHPGGDYRDGPYSSQSEAERDAKSMGLAKSITKKDLTNPGNPAELQKGITVGKAWRDSKGNVLVKLKCAKDVIKISGDDCDGADNDDPECRAMFNALDHGKGIIKTVDGAGTSDDTLSTIKAAAEHLEDASADTMTPKMHKTAHNYHAKALHEVHRSLTNEGNPAEVKAVDAADDDETEPQQKSLAPEVEQSLTDMREMRANLQQTMRRFGIGSRQ